MSALPSIQLVPTGLALIRCTGWLGVFGAGPILSAFWWILLIAWIIVFILWLRALMAYGKHYREYQQRYGEPYRSPLEANKRTRIMLQYLRRLEVLLRNLNLKRRLRDVGQMAVPRINRHEAKDLSRAALRVHQPGRLFRAVGTLGNFFRRFWHGKRAVKPNTERSHGEKATKL